MCRGYENISGLKTAFQMGIPRPKNYYLPRLYMPPSRKHTTIAKKTRKTRKTSKRRDHPQFEREITLKFLEILNTIKLYHWKTYNYATHKATDELYSKLGELVDQFIEVLMGKYETRIHLDGIKTLRLRDMKSHNEFKQAIHEYKEYLVALDKNSALQSMSNTDLYNIRDEMLGNLNQFLYLYTMK